MVSVGTLLKGIGDQEDEGVCTVKEIQQVTIYGGILEFSISSKQVICKFDAEASKETGVEELVINYSISEVKWIMLRDMAKKVFRGEQYFMLSDEFIA